MARALEQRRRASIKRRSDSAAPEILRARDAARTRAGACTSGTCATTRSATRWRATCGCAATTCCIPWAGTRSACRPKTPPSSSGRHPREWTLSQHRRDEAAASPHGLQLRLGPRSHHLRARILSLEPVVLPEDAGARPGLSQEGAGQLVPGVRHRAGQRTGGGRLLLAARDHAGGAARAGTVVLEDHRLRRRAAARHRRQARRRLAGARAHHAAQLDRPVGRLGDRFHAGRYGRANPRVHHARRHHLRRDVRDPRAGASAGRRSCSTRRAARGPSR